MMTKSRRRFGKLIVVLSLCLSLTLMPLPARAGSITTPEIIFETTNPATLHSCMQWALIGLCVWLDCDPSGCRIRLAPLFANFNPDLVTSGYHRVGENPWVEMAALYGPLQKAAGQGFVNSLLPGLEIGEGNRPDEKFHRSHEDLRFKEADAIGHPLPTEALFLAALAAGVTPVNGEIWPADDWLLCPSETAPFTPYLLSTLDFVAWRLALPETLFPQALIPGLREIGHWPLNTWQAVYPRHGFTMQSEDPKAGAVVVQRAGDVVTRLAQPHVYLPTAATRPPTPGLMVFWPEPLVETRCDTGWFQMLVPLRPKSCEVFGQNDLFGFSWADFKSDEAADYAWNLWRPYQCCEIKGEVLLEVIRWMAWPYCD